MGFASSLRSAAVAAAVSAVLMEFCAAAPVEIRLFPRVQVDGPQVRLGDVAAVNTKDVALQRTLSALPLGSAPSPGITTRIDRETLERWVAARYGVGNAFTALGESSALLQWTGAVEVEVASAAQQLAGEEIVRVAQQSLVRWLSQYSGHVEVHAASNVRDLVVPPGTPQLKARPTVGKPAGRMQVWVDVWVDNRYVRTAAVSFVVNAWVAAKVPRENMSSGTEIVELSERAGFAEKQVDLAALSRAPLSEKDIQSHGQRLRRTVRVGEPLTVNHVEPIPAVVRGRWAHLEVRSGDVRVQSRVEVLQDGKLGEIVLVKTPGGREPVMAKVTAAGVVEVAP